MPNSNESSESEFSNENQQNIINRNSNSLSKKNRHHQNYSKNIYIGTKNAEKWDNIRTNLSFKNDVEFVTYLLELSENEQLRKNGCNNNINEKPDDFNRPAVVDPENLQSQTFQKKTKKVQFQEDELNDEGDGVDEDCSGVSGCTTVKDKNEVEKCPPLFLKTKSFINEGDDDDYNDDDDEDDDDYDDGKDYELNDDKKITENVILDCRIAEKIKSDEKVLCLSFNVKDLNDKENSTDTIQSKKRKYKTVDEDATIADAIIQTDKKQLKKFNKKRLKHDIRKAPLDAKLSKELYELEEDDGMDPYDDEDDSVIINKNLDEKSSSDDDYSTEDYQEINENVEKSPRTKKIKIRKCSDCNTKHIPNECFIKKSINQLNDSIGLQQWREQNNVQNVLIKSEDVEGDDDDDDESFSSDASLQDEEVSSKKSKTNHNITSFAEASIPVEFEIRKENDFSIFTKTVIPKYTKLGPLIGVVVRETDIIDDNNMKFIIETYNGTKSIFISMENKNNSNWLRFLRPAPNRELRNLTLVCVDGIVFFVTCNDIDVDCELLYWSDEINSAWDKKKIERTNCGGCNLKFEHPLYYRTHCSVFHDPSFSLTIRKYHCKVCGTAVLGKENIMKHAAQMHEGKGAYQCQYCKKFFLRLNYLEMHRTYGCSANPQRARPLCDFCGRKFCQPQKLKVHIKRMHSDMAEVLRDFQCKLCSKLLGSRAALQRHSKEVHSRNSTVVSCPRCQKLFQNRSNLKIHMLTHSGVRPFRCIEGTCSAAFTTKQCLQFHYKKVHGYAQEQMPKIERSVAYTFDAYSGGVKIDKSGGGEIIRRRRQLSEDDQLSMDNENEELFFEQETSEQKFEERQSSISNICKNETNLSLLSTTISSFLNQEISREKNKNLETDDEIDDNDVDEKNKTINPQLNIVETFLSNSHDMSLIPTINKPKEHEYNTNLIVSKGSKKWIDSDDHDKLNEPNLLNMNRDFISKLIDENKSCGNHDNDDENSILDVVETQNPQNSFHMENNENLLQLQHLNSSSHHQSSLINSFYNNNRGSSISTSASMLVEAALSSVSNIIGNENENCSNLIDERNNCDSVQHDLVIDQNRSYDHKFMKNLNNFSHLIPMGQFSGSPSNNPSPNNVLGNNHEIDIDSASTPSRTMDHSDKIYQETNDQSFDHRNTPSPRAISPGHDYSSTLCPSSTPMMRSFSHQNIVSPPASPGLPRYDFGSKSCSKNIRDHLNNMSSDDENSIIVAQNLSMNNHENVNTKMKLNPHMDLLYSKYEHDTLSHEENELNDRMKYNNDHGMSDMSDLRNNTHSESISDFQGLDMTSRSGLGIGSGYHTSNFQMPSSGMNLTLNRYHHHIYDILSERDQQQQQQEHHQHPLQQQQQQQQQQQIQHMIQDQLGSEQTDQATSVDLSRTANYVSSPPQLQYSHSHSDMLRMVSLDLTPNGGPPGMLTNNHLRHSLSSQIQQSSRELDHNRILTDNRVNSSDQLTSTNHRLLVDPTAHLLMEQNNRILESNRILPRGFGAYHHQVPSNYHHRPGLSTSPHSTNPSNYHSFSAYY